MYPPRNIQLFKLVFLFGSNQFLSVGNILTESQAALKLETVINHHGDLHCDFHGFIFLVPADRKKGLTFFSKVS